MVRVSRDISSVFFKTLAIELQRSAVFGDSANDVVWGAVWDLGFNFEGHPHIRPHQPGKVCNHLFCDTARVATHARCVEGHRSVEASGLSWCLGFSAAGE